MFRRIRFWRFRSVLAVACCALGALAGLRPAEAADAPRALPSIVTSARPALGESDLFGFAHPLQDASDSAQKVIGSDSAQGDFFGWAVGIDGGTAVVGAYGATIDGQEEQGAAYVFTESGGLWTQQAKLVADDGRTFDIFGSAVAISGSVIAIGAYQSDRSHGAVYVFTGAGAHWTQKAKLTADNGANNDCLGWSVATSQGTVIAGSPFAVVDGLQVGAAYVFTPQGDTWLQTQELSASDRAKGDMFGNAISIDGTTAVIANDSASIGGNAGQGAAYVFDGSGGTWSQQAKLVADDGVAFDNFGRSVAVAGPTILVGAPYAAIGDNAFEGAVYAYKGPPQWQQFQKLTASDGVADGYFGWSLGMSGSKAMVGATSYNDTDQGEAYVFSLSDGAWTQTESLTSGDDTLDFFGVTVAISGDNVFVGEPFAHIGDNYDQGAAYAYGPSGDAIFVDGFDGAP